MRVRTIVIALIAVVAATVITAGCIPVYEKLDNTAYFNDVLYCRRATFWEYTSTYISACHCYPVHYTVRSRLTLFGFIVLSDEQQQVMISDDGTRLVPVNE